MKSAAQWMIRRGHIPLHPQTRLATDPLHQPELWMRYEDAVAYSQQDNSADGVGFALTEGDPYFFIDLDDCYDGTQWSPLALKMVNTFNGAHVELSQGGRGLHIYGKATGPIPDHSCKNNQLKIELYTARKFVHFTDRQSRGDTEHDCTAALHQLITDYFPPRSTTTDDEWTTEPREDWNGFVDDEELLAAAFRCTAAGSVWGGKACFGDLWEAREDILGQTYPNLTGTHAYDQSSADAALAQHLAFWTGCDCERIDRLMRQSKLYRDKWDDRGEYYLPRTIMNACGMQMDVHSRTVAEPPGPQPTPEATEGVPEEVTSGEQELRVGYQFLPITEQIRYFRGCVYIESMHKVFIPGGKLLDQPRFKAVYGGYYFAVDSTNDKTVKNAWEAFTESQGWRFPKVDEAAFRPDLPPGEIFEKNGTTKVNIYHPQSVARKQGDPSRFLEHLAKIIPDKDDQAILLAYMSACVKHPGVKFQWCPLIQGVEGNGKTLFSRVVAEAIGQKYCYFPRPQHLDSEFNGWVANKIFIGIEDIYVSEKKQHLMERLKPLITGEVQEVRVMQTDGYCAEVCCNFILNSNHKDGIRKGSNDRRYAPFFTAQQCKEDLTRDGLTEDYFRSLYDWLKDEGYAIVSEFLHTYPIPDELNPAKGCQRAPHTSSTDEAIRASLGSIEQAILEATEEGRPGFAGGYISSVALETLLVSMRAQRSIPPNKRRDLLQQLGYDYHPALVNGRVNSPSDCDDGKKPKLFVKEGSEALRLTKAADILHDYSVKQRGYNNPFEQPIPG